MIDSSGLVDAFLMRAPAEVREILEADEDLGQSLADMTKAAQAAWSGVVVDPERYVGYVAERLPEGAGADVLSTIDTDSLYLACACAHGDGKAIMSFESAFFPELDRSLGHVAKTETQRDEVKGVLREKLFVAREDLPKIAEFNGRGSLKKWLKVVAVRAAVDLFRKHRRELPLENEELPEAMSEDIVLSHLKDKYRGEFKIAFGEAFAGMPPRQRNFLRMHIIDNLSIDDIGAMHNVHRTTAARWLRDARDEVAERTRTLLQAKLRIEQGELDSILRLIRSRIDLSVTRLFDS